MTFKRHFNSNVLKLSSRFCKLVNGKSRSIRLFTKKM